MWKTFFLANLKEGPIKVGLGRLLSSGVENLWKTFLANVEKKSQIENGWVGLLSSAFGFGIPKKKARQMWKTFGKMWIKK